MRGYYQPISLFFKMIQIVVICFTVVENGIDGVTLLGEDFGEAEQKELIPRIKDRITFKKALQELK